MTKLYNKLTILLSCLLFNIVTCKIHNEEDEMGTVIFANVLFRHGDRTPIDPYPNDPYKNSSFWPVGFGQLTNTGKKQEYELGEWLRARYDHLLTEHYSEDVVYVQSTNVDRTLMSAATNLAGMYPPSGAQRWNPKLNWQPIPIHTVPEHLDKVLASKAPCPAYEEELKKVLHSKEMQDLNQMYANVYKVLRENTGKNISNFDDILNVYSTLWIENLYNMTLPSWTKGVFPQPMAEASTYGLVLPTWTLKLARLKSGLLLEDMIKHMKHKIDNKPQPVRNMWVYSAHDTTVANLLNTLGVFDLHNPPYTALVMLELRVDANNQHYVTLFYRNSTTREPYLLKLPGCAAACPLDQFITYCQPLIPQDWERECRMTSLFSLPPTLPYTSLTVAVLVISLLLTLVLVASVALYWQSSRRHTHCQDQHYCSSKESVANLIFKDKTFPE